MKMSEPVFPKIDLPGQWRWKDCYFTSTSRKVKAQRKGRFFWYTVADEIYWPGKSHYLYGIENAILSATAKAAIAYSMNKSTEIHPA
jgi:hypothetical protein